MSERLETLAGLLEEVKRAAGSWDPGRKGSSEGLAWALEDLRDALPHDREDLASLVDQARQTLEGVESLGGGGAAPRPRDPRGRRRDDGAAAHRRGQDSRERGRRRIRRERR